MDVTPFESERGESCYTACFGGGYQLIIGSYSLVAGYVQYQKYWLEVLGGQDVELKGACNEKRSHD